MTFSRRSDVRTPRRHQRVRVEVPVSIVAGGRTAGTIVFDTQDLSIGGAFLASSLLLEVDEELELEIALGDERVRTVGRVVHVEREGTAGMGIEFIRLTDGDRDRIRRFLTRR